MPTKEVWECTQETSHFKAASNEFQSKIWKRCGNTVPTRSRPTTPLVTQQVSFRLWKSAMHVCSPEVCTSHPPNSKCWSFKAVVPNRWVAKLLQVGREMFRDNLNIFLKSYWLIQTAFFRKSYVLRKPKMYYCRIPSKACSHFQPWIAIVGSTNPRQVRWPRVTYVRTRPSAFHASVASFLCATCW